MCDYVVRSLLQNPALGATADDRRNTIYRGGLVIKTQIDPTAMDAAQQSVTSKVKATDPVISTMVEVQPGTGLILAMAQSRPVMGTNADAGETFYNYAVSASMGGAEGYQAGSTFKAFTLATALEQGIPVNKKLPGSTPMQFKGKAFRTCDADGKAVSFKFPTELQPENVDRSYGEIDMRKGAAMSVNTYFVGLEALAGICQAARMAELAGVQLSSGGSMVQTYSYIPSFTLGVAEVTPLSMAVGYATFAARGVHCDPIIVSSIASRAGQAIATQSANCKQVIRPEVADGVNYVLQNVMAPGGTGNPRSAPRRASAGRQDRNHRLQRCGVVRRVHAERGGCRDGRDRQVPALHRVLDAQGRLAQGRQAAHRPAPRRLRFRGRRRHLDPRDDQGHSQPAGDRLHEPAGLDHQRRQGADPEHIGYVAGAGAGDARGGWLQRAEEERVRRPKPAGTHIGATCDGLVGGTCYLMYSQGPRPPDAPSGP